jgi:hypothetical protein
LRLEVNCTLAHKVPFQFLKMNTSLLVIQETDVVKGELQLADADFPANFKNMAHPDDYIIQNQPIIERIFNCKPHHNRFLLRACWKVGDDQFIPMTFVCDTGAPMHFYLCPKATEILEGHKRIQMDELQTTFVVSNKGLKSTVQETPMSHQPGNVLGLLFLRQNGFFLTDDNHGFDFKQKFLYL